MFEYDDVIYNILINTDFKTLKSVFGTDRKIHDYRNKFSFWLEKFTHENFSVYHELKTIDDCIGNYKTILEAERIVNIILEIAKIEVEFDKRNKIDPNKENISKGDIVVNGFYDFISYCESFGKINIDLIESTFKNLIEPELIIAGKLEMEYEGCIDKITYNLLDDGSYETRMLGKIFSENFSSRVDVGSIISRSKVMRDLTYFQYLILLTNPNTLIIDDGDGGEFASLYYDNTTNLEDLNNYFYQNIKKFFTRLGIRKVLESRDSYVY